MATVNGTEYDHIDIKQGSTTTKHMLKDATARGDIENLKSAISAQSDEIGELKSVNAGWVNGTFSTSTGVIESSTTRCVSDYLFIAKGAKAVINPNGQQRIVGFFSMDKSTFVAVNNTWASTTLDYTATADGYLLVQIRKSNSNPDIAPADVTCTIEIANTIQTAIDFAIPAYSAVLESFGTAVPFGDLVSATIGSNNKWELPSSVMRSVIVDASSADYLFIQANANYSCVYALLTDNSHTLGETPSFFDDGRHVLQPGESAIVDVSASEIKYVYVLKYGVQNSSRTDNQPSIAMFSTSYNNGKVDALIDFTRDLINTVDGHGNDIADINADLNNLHNYVRDVPKNQGVRNAYKKAMQLKSIPWTLLTAIPNDASATGISAGNHTGVDYSSVKEYDKFVGFNVSLKTFMTAAHNPYSLLYTEDVKASRSTSQYGLTYHGKNCGAYFGIVCNIFVLYALGFGIPWNTAEWAYLNSQNVFERVYDQSASGLELMDVIWEPGHGNIIIDIYRDSRGNPVKIYWAESVQNFPQIHEYTPEQVNARLASKPGTIYRYRDLYKNLEYNPSEFVAVDGEPEPAAYVYNDDICTFAGDYAAFHTGEEIWINYNLGETVYTGLTVYNSGGTEIASYTLPSGHKISIGSELSAGKYTAVLTGNGTSEPTHFEVIDTTVAATNNDGQITVQFSSVNGTPIYAQMTYVDGSSRGIVPIPADNNGTLTFNANDVLNAQYPGETFANTTYLKVFFKGDYGTVRNVPIDLQLI